MRGLSMVGVTHRSSSLDLLERVAMGAEQRGDVLDSLKESGCAEAVVLSTCSRTEIYTEAAPGGPTGLLSLLAARAGRAAGEMEAAAQIRTGQSAVEHLFRVTAGLDSRLVGEVDIHGQTRAAFRQAGAAGMAGPSLGRLFPAALRCSERVRAETTLGQLARSLGQRAVDLGLATFPAGSAPAVLVVGSGRMAAAAVERLGTLGHRVTVAARNEQVAARLAGPVRVLPLAELAGGVDRADMIICATSAASHVVTLPHIRQAMGGRTRPLTVVDLAVPRNVDPDVSSITGVRLINMEDMRDDLADASLAEALATGRALAKTEARQYAHEQAARRAGPVIAAIRQHVEQLCKTELSRAVAAGVVEPDDISNAAHSVAGKLLHRPTITARTAAASGNTETLLMLCDIFGVEAGQLGLSIDRAVPA